jgi:hypothetical protein
MPEMILTSRAERVELRSLIPMGVRCGLRAPRSPSPLPSPQGRGRIIGSLLANRVSCELLRAGRSGCSLFLRLTVSATNIGPRNLIPMPMRDVVRTPHSPSPQPSPQRRGRIIASRSEQRESCELSSARRSRCSLSSEERVGVRGNGACVNPRCQIPARNGRSRP